MAGPMPTYFEIKFPCWNFPSLASDPLVDYDPNLVDLKFFKRSATSSNIRLEWCSNWHDKSISDFIHLWFAHEMCLPPTDVDFSVKVPLNMEILDSNTAMLKAGS